MNLERCELSVIVVNINQRELLKKCLRSIFREVQDISIEVIVVDNDSTDGSRKMVRSDFPAVRLIQKSGQRGFAENYNSGIRVANGENLLILNNDTQLLPYKGNEKINADKKFLDAMVWRLNQKPKVACMGPMLLYPDGKIQAECARNLPTLRDIIFGALWLDKLFPKSRLFARLNMTYWDHTTERYVDCVSGACMLVRKSVIKELGSFDEIFFLYGEDTDLCKRIKSAGYSILYIPGFKVVHMTSQTIRFREAYAGKVEALLSKYKYLRKHCDSTYAFLFRILVVPLVILRIILMENSLIAPVFKRSPSPITKRIAACVSILRWKSMYTGQTAR